MKFSVLAGAALILAACARGPVDPDTGRVLNVANLPDQKFVVGGYEGPNVSDLPPKRMSELTQDELKNVFSSIDKRLCRQADSYEDCLDKLVRARKKGLTNGISGIPGQAFLATAQSNRDTNGKRVVHTRGQILDECLHDTSLKGYYYDAGITDPNVYNLRLCVVMETEIVNPSGNNSKFTYQYFHVEAKNARVDERDLRNVEDIFPEAAKHTGLKIRATEGNANFMYKLYAYGDAIEIKNYWEAKAKNSTDNPSWKKYTKGQTGIPAPIRPYFEPDAMACVDMLFEDYPPMDWPDGLAAGIHYCLGRCKNPPIVNTR